MAQEQDRPSALWELWVYAKAPQPGECKSRLAATVGDEPAAQLAAAFLTDTLCMARDARVEIVLAGNRSSPAPFAAWLGDGVEYLSQGEGSLGARLERGYRTAFQRGARGALAIGADTPHLSGSFVEEAVAILAEGSVAFGPADDGGYYLLGLPASFPWDNPQASAIFREPAWGEASVGSTTTTLLTRAGIPWQSLPPLADVDTETELRQLLASASPSAIPETRRVSAQIGRWPDLVG